MSKIRFVGVVDPSKMVKKMVESEYKKFKFEMRGRRLNKSEVERYLNEETEEDSEDFNILEWWKLNGHRFPILAQLARDVLAIPILTAFSTGGRVLDAFRSSLTPKFV